MTLTWEVLYVSDKNKTKRKIFSDILKANVFIKEQQALVPEGHLFIHSLSILVF